MSSHNGGRKRRRHLRPLLWSPEAGDMRRPRKYERRSVPTRWESDGLYVRCARCQWQGPERDFERHGSGVRTCLRS